MIKSAADFYHTGKYVEAIDLLLEADKTAPSIRLKAHLARCYAKMPKYADDSLKLWAEIEREAPNSPYIPEAMLARATHLRTDPNSQREVKALFLEVLEKYPNSEAADDALIYLSQIALNEHKGDLARQGLETLLLRPQSYGRDQAEFLIGDMNMSALYSPEPDPMSIIYTVKSGDAISRLSRQFKVPEDLITGLNRVSPTSLRIGQRLKIPKLDNLEAIIDKADFSLKLYCNKVFLKRYRVGLASGDRVKTGRYSVKTKSTVKAPRPTKTPAPTRATGRTATAMPTPLPAEILPPTTDPLNPVGAKRIDLSRNDLYFHRAASDNILGKYSELANIAVNAEDLDEIYSLLNQGTIVVVINTAETKSEEK